MQKLGIRLMPSVRAALLAGEKPSKFIAFAVASLLRFLTPIGEQTRLGEQRPVFAGRLDPQAPDSPHPSPWTYAGTLSVSPVDGTYEFADGDGLVPLLLRPLGRPGGASVAATASIARQVLSTVAGFNPNLEPAHVELARQVAEFLQRMLSGEPALSVLRSLEPDQPLLLQRRQLGEAVAQEVEAAEAIDVHTHLFAGVYGRELMQFGIDAMLTLQEEPSLACSPDMVAQYLAVSAEDAVAFGQLPQSEQAERVWRALFVTRSPLSETCRGVVSTLAALGLHEEIGARDLPAIRRWYAAQEGDMFTEKVMRLAKLKYVISSHSPFFARVQLDACLRPPPPPPRYRAALEVDQLLEGEWEAVREAVAAAGEPPTLRGVASLLERCVDALRPEYLSCSTPHTFEYAAKSQTEAVRDAGDGADGADDAAVGASEAASDALLDAPLEPPPSSSTVLDSVLLPLCKRRRLPLLLRMGTRRGLNPSLGLAGDGVGSAKLEALSSLCSANPKVKFLATVLNAADQHQMAVLASRFRNLHLWGCWWYCNMPSVIAPTTAMRLELLGPQFTYLASSARIHDQLIYKWRHGRALLTQILSAKYELLMEAGWPVSRGDIRRDVQQLLGGAYEEFLRKAL